jgi:hypothetical protein
MRRLSIWLGLPLATLLGAAGCANMDNLKPPKHPDEYRLPPENDATYSEPTKYDKKLLNEDHISLAADADQSSGPGGGLRGPGGGGMGGGPGGH